MKKILEKNKIFLGLLIFVFIIGGSFFLIKPKTTEKVLASDVTNKSLLSPTPSPMLPSVTPMPTIVATPTAKPVVSQQVQNGFCINVPILTYHHIQPSDQANAQGHTSLNVDNGIFDSQMSYLVANGYHTISSDQVVNALINHQQLPAKSIVITIDDGYDDNYNFAFGIIKKYNVTADLMIPSGLINNPGYMTWAQLKEMAGNSLVHVYNHTWSHAALGAVDRTKIEFEVTTSQNQLQAELGKNINILTYPYGSFSPLAIQILKEHGFIGGISTISGTVQCDSYIMTLHRTRIGNAPLSSYGF